MVKIEKKDIYPNTEFKSMDDYVAFCRKHMTFGKEAYAMKRRINQKTRIPEPKIKRIIK